jgi:hypothetical protein
MLVVVTGLLACSYLAAARVDRKMGEAYVWVHSRVATQF